MFCYNTLRLLIIAATKFSGLAHNLFYWILVFAIANIIFVQAIMIASNKFSDFDGLKVPP